MYNSLGLLLLKKLENGYKYIIDVIETLQALKQNRYQRGEFTRCTETECQLTLN